MTEKFIRWAQEVTRQKWYRVEDRPEGERWFFVFRKGVHLFNVLGRPGEHAQDRARRFYLHQTGKERSDLQLRPVAEASPSTAPPKMKPRPLTHQRRTPRKFLKEEPRKIVRSLFD